MNNFQFSVTINNKNNQSEKTEKLSAKCAKYWWKLKLSDRKSHNHLMKIQLLSPFLFCKVYQDEIWLDWAREAGLLTQKRISAIDELSADEMKNIDLIEKALLTLQTEIDRPNASTIARYLEDLIESLQECSGLSNLSRALNKLERKFWFDSVRKKLDENDNYTFTASKKSYAVFLAAWQVSHYMQLIYQGETPLKTFQLDSELDDKTSAAKEQGNNLFKKNEISRAINQYTSILMNKPYIHILYSNRAVCYQKKQEYRSALSDCRRVVTLDPTWEKGQYLYAQALISLNQKNEAIKSLYNARKVCKTKGVIETLLRENDGAHFCRKTSRSGSSSSNSKNTKNEQRNDDDFSDMEDDNMPGLDSQSSDDDDPIIPDLTMDANDSDDETHDIASVMKKRREREERVRREKAKQQQQAQQAQQKLDKANEKLTPKSKARKTSELSKNKNGSETKKLSPKEIRKRDLTISVTEGSEFLLQRQYHKAMHEYEKAVDIVKKEPNLLSKQDIVVIYYAHGVSYLEAGSYLDLEKSMKVFQHINVEYKCEKFALSYLGIARIYVKQKLYSAAISPLKTASVIGKKNLNVCTWPGISAVIEESQRDKFKKMIKDLLEECNSPPQFDAVCKYSNCQYERKGIYFESPDFKGIYQLYCTQNCLLEFHVVCWKKSKTDFFGKKYEKDFLRESCITPDCFGVIKRITMFSDKQDFKVLHTLRENIKPAKKPFVDKSKRMKPSSFKRLRKYLNRQLMYKEISEDQQRDELIEELEEKINEDENRNEQKSGAEKTVKVILPPEGELVVLNKKNEENLMQKKKSKKSKTKKGQKQKVKLEIPYNFSKDKESLHHFHDEAPFALPDSLQADLHAFEQDWRNDQNDMYEPQWQMDGLITPYGIDNKDSIVENFDFDQYAGIVQDPKESALHIFSMFEQMLEAKGWADVMNSSDIMKFLEFLDENSRILINQVGGLPLFLSKCKRFSFDDVNPNIVYLTCQQTYYDICYKNIGNGSEPATETPLFLENLDFQPFRRRQRTDTGSSSAMNPDAPEFTPKSSPTLDMPIDSYDNVYRAIKVDDNKEIPKIKLAPIQDPPSAADRTFSGLRELAERLQLIDHSEDVDPCDQGLIEIDSVKNELRDIKRQESTALDDFVIISSDSEKSLEKQVEEDCKKTMNSKTINRSSLVKCENTENLANNVDKNCKNNNNLAIPDEQKPKQEKQKQQKMKDEKPSKKDTNSKQIGKAEFTIDFSGSDDSFTVEASLNGKEKRISSKFTENLNETTAFIEDEISGFINETMHESKKSLNSATQSSNFTMGPKVNKKTGIQLIDACMACNGPLNVMQSSEKKDSGVEVSFKSVLKEAFSTSLKQKVRKETKVEIKQIETKKEETIKTTCTTQSHEVKQTPTQCESEFPDRKTFEYRKNHPLGHVKGKDVTKQFFNSEPGSNSLIDPGASTKVTVNVKKSNSTLNKSKEFDDALRMPLKEGTPENVPVSICGVKVPVTSDIILPNLPSSTDDENLKEKNKLIESNEKMKTNVEGQNKYNQTDDFFRIDMGFQVDNIKTELCNIKTDLGDCQKRNEVLMNTNKKLIEELKATKPYISKCDDLRDTMHKQKVKYSTLLNSFKNELTEKEKQIDKLKRDSTSIQQTLQNDIKKLQTEKKDLVTQSKALTKKIGLSKETEYEKQLKEKNKELEKLRQDMKQVSSDCDQEKKKHEDITQELLATVNLQRRRAEKVEVALLEMKKNFVTSVYHQRAATVTSVLYRLQHLQKTKNVQKSMKVWNDYKIFFQTCFERMQDEFAGYVQSVLQGTRLEEIPPAKFADPPPFPPMPMFEDMPAPIPMPQHQIGPNQPPTNIQQDNEVPTKVPTPPISDHQQSNQANHNGAVASPRKDEAHISPNQIERLISRLLLIFPKLKREDIFRFVHAYLRQHPDLTLNGPRFDSVVSLIEVFIRRKSTVNPQSPAKTSRPPSRTNGVAGNEQFNRPKQSAQASSSQSKLRTRANQIPANSSNAALDTFELIDGKPVAYGEGEPCVICYEEMTSLTSEQLNCGHTFHKKCICSWLNEQRTCPVCRNHALLPEEFPALGT